MTFKAEFPIRAKLLVLASALVLGSTALYLSLALKLFEDDKTALVYELNAGNVKTLAAQTQASLQKELDKLSLLTRGHRDARWVGSVFESDADLVSYALYVPTQDAGQWTPLSSFKNQSLAALYPSLDASQLPLAAILSQKIWVANVTTPGNPPLLALGLGLELQEGDAPSRPAVAIALVRPDAIFKEIGAHAISTTYIVDSQGGVIAHPDPVKVGEHALLKDIPIVQDAVASRVALQIKRFDWKGESWLGAYAAVGVGGLYVISQVPGTIAFRAAHQLVNKSLLYALFVITLAFLLLGYFSSTITDPIEKLVAATRKLADWDFSATVHVRTRDELSILARSFNAMASALQGQKAQLEANRSELELKVRERTAALESQKKQLADAQESLLRTTRLASLGELAGAAAHEVLNPLNNINIRVERIRGQVSEAEQNDVQLMREILAAWRKSYGQGGMTELMRDLATPVKDSSKPLVEEDLENLEAISKDATQRLSERKEDLDFLTREINRINRIVSTMRQLSRVGGSRQPLDIHLPIQDTLLTLADQAEKKGIALVRDFSSEPRERFIVVADKDELVQVFANLGKNALQAIQSAERRAGTLKISTRRNGERIEVRFADNGSGISAAHRARLFEPNFTTKSLDEGTGLGLSISRRLVRAFGGDIELERSVEGEGTTFLLWFTANGDKLS